MTYTLLGKMGPLVPTLQITLRQLILDVMLPHTHTLHALSNLKLVQRGLVSSVGPRPAAGPKPWVRQTPA